MKKFKGLRPLKELRADCKQRGWRMDTRMHDHEGSDYVGIHFKVGNIAGKALLSTFNGKFFGELHPTGEWFDSEETKHERKRWFKTLCRAFYIA